jgi:hypothetical protein
VSLNTRKLLAKGGVLVGLVWQVLWRSAGLALMTFPIGMGVGAGLDLIPGVAADAVTSGFSAFGATFVIAATSLGKSITTTGKADLDDIERAFRKAATAAEERQKQQR